MSTLNLHFSTFSHVGCYKTSKSSVRGCSCNHRCAVCMRDSVCLSASLLSCAAINGVCFSCSWSQPGEHTAAVWIGDGEVVRLFSSQRKQFCCLRSASSCLSQTSNFSLDFGPLVVQCKWKHRWMWKENGGNLWAPQNEILNCTRQHGNEPYILSIQNWKELANKSDNTEMS